MNYTIVKRIKIDAETLEEAIQNHNTGRTISLTAEESSNRPAPQPNRNSNPGPRPAPTRISPSLTSRPG